MSGMQLIYRAAPVLLLACLSSCRHQTVPPSRAEIERAFEDAPPAAETSASSAVADLDVYIDGSMSMRGYASPPHSHFLQVLRHVVNSGISAGHYNVSLYKFSEKVLPVEDDDRPRVYGPDFYNGLDTPLSALFDRISQPAFSGHISVVISDLVQSEKGRDEAALVKSLLRIASRGLELRLLGFRSAFVGDYYVESLPKVHGRQQSIRLNLGEGLPGLGRPFYLLVAAPNRTSVDLLERYILERAGAHQSFDPTEAPVHVKQVQLARGKERARELWNPFLQAETVALPSAATRHFFSFVEQLTPLRDGNDLALELATEVKLPMVAPGKIRCTTRKVSYLGRFSKPQMVPVPTVFEGGSDSMRVTYSFPRPAPGTWDVYQVAMRAGEGNLACPIWVQEWTTDADMTPNNGAKTFQLSLLVDSMVHAITESQVFSEQFIAISRGK